MGANDISQENGSTFRALHMHRFFRKTSGYNILIKACSTKRKEKLKIYKERREGSVNPLTLNDK
jgi:hypothetical protein